MVNDTWGDRGLVHKLRRGSSAEDYDINCAGGSNGWKALLLGQV